MKQGKDMTPPTTESRLDRLEAIAETVLLAIQQQQQQAQNTQTEMRQSIEDVVRMIATLAESADEDRKLIIGLQTENRRILDHLLNQQ
jgi:GAF domain-containing protein